MKVTRDKLIKKFKEWGIDISKACEVKITPFKVVIYKYKKDKNGKYIKTDNNDVEREKTIYNL